MSTRRRFELEITDIEGDQFLAKTPDNDTVDGLFMILESSSDEMALGMTRDDADELFAFLGEMLGKQGF